MAKFIVKAFLIACILFGLGNYASYLMTGKLPGFVNQTPEIPDFNISKLTDALSSEFKITNEEKPVETRYLYKWRDEKGVIHYTSEKPSEDINYESIGLSNDTNVIPAVSENEIIGEKPDQQQPPELPSTELPTNVYSPAGIEHIFNQANDIQNLVNEQFSHQENNSNQ